MKASISLASTFVLTILVLTHPALVWATDSFTIEANPTSASTPQGTSVSYTITVGSFSGLPVTLGVTGLPPGATAAFNPPSLQPPIGGTTSSALYVTARVDTPVGSYPLNVTASDSSSGTHWVIVTLIVVANTGDFVMSVSPNSLVINRTESETVIVKVQALGGWRWGLALNVTGLPEHVTGTFTPPVLEPPVGGTASSAMRISVGVDASNGTYPLTIVATVVNATITRSASFTLIIPPTEVMATTTTTVSPPPSTIPFIGVPEILLAILLGFFVVARMRRRRGSLSMVATLCFSLSSSCLMSWGLVCFSSGEKML